MYCPLCGTVAVPKSKYQGSGVMSILLLILFLPIGLIYAFWRSTAPKYVCPNCKRPGMIPANSPAAGGRKSGMSINPAEWSDPMRKVVSDDELGKSMKG